jgi:hypothetical protein
MSIPPIIQERYEELYDLVQNKSKNARITAAQLAEYNKCDIDYIRSCIQSGKLPFAFSADGKGRNQSYIGILPFYNFETQNVMGKELTGV